MAKQSTKGKSKAKAGRSAARKNDLMVRTHGGDGARHVRMRALAGAGARAAEIEHEIDETGATPATTAAPKRGAKTNERAMTTTTREDSGANKPTSGNGAKGKNRGRPAATVAVLLHDARELFDAARRVGKKLVAGGLDESYLKDLPSRIAMLADAQKAWERQRARITPGALKSAREEATQLRTDMMAAGRFVLRRDAGAQRELDKIAEGEGLEDLVQDLRDLAEFYTRRATALRDADVPKTAIERCRDLADQLTLAVEAEREDTRLHMAREERNRAIAMLDEAVSEVRHAGRYVFRAMPARLALFRHEYRRVTEQRRAQ